jgi:hypothetical protein
VNRETLFTFVLDYKGGTYISQVSDLSIAGAVEKWAKTRADRDLTTWGLVREDLTKLAETDTPMAIEGCHNVWCLSNSTEEGLVLINVIATQS